ncbi:pre-mRNA-splicing factor prp46 [Gregarina niphandrodes]|uniref:Pre-mRNA-splicing factor prp46 n=1 Tax=Gregarina niphandrodes TaxID=110365 RepID=A0A023AYF4_GRENI|nr:pre-mRNA-splicing factor prp46 [Gregarina niphandrodes]EZG43691.1 pre-mRNA-splicing factor prp46 [Gregarina niphandrodes]|eukprot:XP_011133074.1 pre-mRNA-splicing factor prp46 [Gregarina niphandrodes]
MYRNRWCLKKVIAGHTGWVRALDVDVSNEWFVSGGNDRLLKVWDLASGALRLTLTGHVHAIRGLKVDSRHPYVVSCSEDHEIKCWDLEQNKVVRNYHGHLNGVYTLALHPTLENILVSGGRDKTVRVWDLRTREEVHCLRGHTDTVFSVLAQGVEPQVVSGSADKTVRCWDLRTGRCRGVLTHHSKSVRALHAHPRLYAFLSGAADSLKVWQGEHATYQRDLSPNHSIINTLAVKDDPDSAIVVAGADNGFLHFYDFNSGHIFQSLESKPVRGSLHAEAGILAAVFDQSETRLLTGEADKTIKIWQPLEQEV